MGQAPLRSMTGYGAARGEAAGVALRLRVRSLNHRFLDLQLRLPAELEALQPAFEQAVRGTIHRGHVELTATFERAPAGRVVINREMAAAYVEAFRELRREFRELRQTELEPAEVLRLPGIVSVAAPEADAGGQLQALAEAVLRDCLADHTRMREREGAAIAEDLRRRLRTMAASVQAVGELRQKFAEAFAARFRARFAQWLAEALPPERLAAEAALLVERSDISEELARLEAHLAEFGHILDQGGEAGKKLDFLLQELNREVNTLLSKTAGLAGEGLAITSHGLTLKAETEKLREQVQNLE